MNRHALRRLLFAFVLLVFWTGCKAPIARGEGTSYETPIGFHLGMLVITAILLLIAWAFLHENPGNHTGWLYLSMIWIPLMFIYMTANEHTYLDDELLEYNSSWKDERRVEFKDVQDVTLIREFEFGNPKLIEFHLVDGSDVRWGLEGQFGNDLLELVERRNWRINRRLDAANSPESFLNDFKIGFLILIIIVPQLFLTHLCAYVYRWKWPQEYERRLNASHEPVEEASRTSRTLHWLWYGSKEEDRA